MTKQMPKPKKTMKNLDDLRKEIPEGGLLNPGLRKGFGEKFDVSGLKKKLFGK